ncbi:post-transcriptional regulator [Virgibacillus byunsanensis]|uniref:Post-transcriptional regulator n=1 Tax=Virgibacillus byunsanensis TaxID=570945 RepID=A0ABW3LL90_9BACI
MELEKTVSEWKIMMKPALDSKTDEFLLMGYSQASNEDIWKCLEQKVWKGNPSKRVHEVIQDIFHLSSSIYISYLTVNAYQEDSDLMTSIAAVTKGL